MWFRTLVCLNVMASVAMAQGDGGGTGGTGGGAAAAPPPGDMLSNWLLMMAMIFFVFYFLVIRPQQKQRKEHETKINALKKGDRIMTTGGIYGTIVGVKETIVVLRIAENVKIEVSKNAIGHVIGKDESAE